MGNMKKETEDRTPEAKRSEVPIHRNGANLNSANSETGKGKKGEDSEDWSLGNSTNQ